MKQPISPKWDPWDPLFTMESKQKYELTSVEFTVTNLCNLRCEHCAVGETLLTTEKPYLPLNSVLSQLDEVESLQTISITGGEPVYSLKTVGQIIIPILEYASSRGIYTQLNTNLTLPFDRYAGWIDMVDVIHISYNYRDHHDFHRMVYAKMDRPVSIATAEKVFVQMIENARQLSDQGLFLSAETFLSPFTAPFITQMHQQIVDMGCVRHEVHPLYPSDFAANMSLLSLDEYRVAVEKLIEDPKIWVLFGTLPFFPCSDDKRDQELWQKLHQSTYPVTVRQDPDGRNRININLFSGEATVTDFAEIPALGNILTDSLTDIFQAWLAHPLAKKYHCYCRGAKCTGPNLLVASHYYPELNFVDRQSNVEVS